MPKGYPTHAPFGAAHRHYKPAAEIVGRSRKASFPTPAAGCQTGRVKWWKAKKKSGFGFIERSDGAGDVFVHSTELSGGLTELYQGQAVKFQVISTSDGLRAVEVTAL